MKKSLFVRICNDIDLEILIGLNVKNMSHEQQPIVTNRKKKPVLVKWIKTADEFA